MAKFSKKLLRKAAKEAKSNGLIDKTKKKENRSTMRDVANTMRQEKRETTSLTWNMHPGDLVRVHDGLLGYIIQIESEGALKLNDWRQEATVMTSRGKIGVHPKTLKVVQKA